MLGEPFESTTFPVKPVFAWCSSFAQQPNLNDRVALQNLPHSEKVNC